ncbi:MAG: DUF397 domain-containing protein [Pseudonocardiaceae bacterium]
MHRISNNMLLALLLEASWQKSHYSNPCGSCVEVARLADGRIAVRNSKHPDGTALIHSGLEIAAFIRSTKKGEFDERPAQA